MRLVPYDGSRPKVSGRAGRYHVNLNDQIEAVYPIGRRVIEILTTEEHPRLLDMVNEVKVAASGKPGGAFLINEHNQVLVPVQDGSWYVAGQYDELLTFDFSGEVIAPEAPPDLEPGDHWPGPRVGMTYTLRADEGDIAREIVTGNREVTEVLSDFVGTDAAGFLAERLRENKRQDRGRIYINEAQEFFAPVGQVASPPYIYLGPLDGEPWFPRYPVASP